MFGKQSSLTDEQLMGMLRHFTNTGSFRLDGLQAELWRRNVNQQQYIDWLRQQKEKESEPKG